MWKDNEGTIKITVNETTYAEGTFANNCSVIFQNTTSKNTKKSAVIRLIYVLQTSTQNNETGRQDVVDGDDNEFIYEYKIEENNGESSQLPTVFQKLIKPINGKNLKINYLL